MDDLLSVMIIAEWKWLRSRDEIYLTLAQRQAKGTAILFAVGAVSGTVLSFELGLLWPKVMAYSSCFPPITTSSASPKLNEKDGPFRHLFAR